MYTPLDIYSLPSDVPGLTRYPSAIFSEADYSPAALASRWQGYFEGATGFPKGRFYLDHTIAVLCVLTG